MNMKLSATVRDRQDGEVLWIERESYDSKKAFRDALHQNGYTIIGRVFAEGDDQTELGDLYWNKGVR